MESYRHLLKYCLHRCSRGKNVYSKAVTTHYEILSDVIFSSHEFNNILSQQGPAHHINAKKSHLIVFSRHAAINSHDILAWREQHMQSLWSQPYRVFFECECDDLIVALRVVFYVRHCELFLKRVLRLLIYGLTRSKSSSNDSTDIRQQPKNSLSYFHKFSQNI